MSIPESSSATSTLLLKPDEPSILADTSPGPFEGPEKLLELWFAPSAEELPEPENHIGNGLAYRPRRVREGDVEDAASEEGEEIRGDVGKGEGWQGLRRVKREVWEDMLKVVKCQVLSVIEGEDIDAYLLSESSLFVAPHCIILKTCGTTINLLGLSRIIDIAREYCGFESVWSTNRIPPLSPFLSSHGLLLSRCFYSRKSYFFPERQVGPHRGWREEVDFLDGTFNKQGSAYTVGPMNGDHWLLYLTSPSVVPQSSIPKSLPAPSSSNIPSTSMLSSSVSSSSSSIINIRPPTHIHQDQTLEILMTHLSPAGREPFFHPEHLDPTCLSDPSSSKARSGHHLGQVLTTHLGIDQLFPKEETTIDAFGFEPCGYSANGIVGTGSGSTLPLTNIDSEGEGGETETKDIRSQPSRRRRRRQVQGHEGGGYFTIHVTPEEGWSFASFECNVPLPLETDASGKKADGVAGTVAARPDLPTLIRKVVDIFQPGRLSITLFLSTPSDDVVDTSTNGAPHKEPADNAVSRQAWTSFSRNMLGEEYERKDRIGYEFDGYDLVFGCFEKKGFEGGKGPDGPAI